MSYPIYIIEADNKTTIVFKKDKEDIPHEQLWETMAAAITAKLLGIPKHKIIDLLYCQKRARISKGLVYYGEIEEPTLLDDIRQAVGEPNLVWHYDEHEARLLMDVAHMRGLLPKVNNDVGVTSVQDIIPVEIEDVDA